MLWMLVFLFVTLVVAGFVVLYVAYPHRGEELPYAPALGERMRTAVRSLPTLSEDEVAEMTASRDARR